MSLLGSAQIATDLQAETDTLGGAQVLESAVYDFKIEMAYMSKSAGGALAVNLHLNNAAGNSMRQTVYISKKTGELYYTKDGKNYPMPGFSQMNAVALLSVGKGLLELAESPKTIKLYDFDAKAEVPKEVPVLMELIGQPISIGVLKHVQDKTALDAPSGKYLPTGETRTLNEIDKIFRTSDGLTTVEVTAANGAPAEAIFKAKWEEKWAGKDKNTVTKGGAVAGAPGVAAAGNTPAASLFKPGA